MGTNAYTLYTYAILMSVLLATLLWGVLLSLRINFGDKHAYPTFRRLIKIGSSLIVCSSIVVLLSNTLHILQA